MVSSGPRSLPTPHPPSTDHDHGGVRVVGEIDTTQSIGTQGYHRDTDTTMSIDKPDAASRGNEANRQ